MLLEISIKILSESLLSLYPIFVKYINIPISLQLWSRFATYIIISFFFINYEYIFNTLFTKDGLLLSIITIIHVYTSYRGFQILESGIAYTLFYLYPLIILILAGEKIQFIMIFALIGLYLLTKESNQIKKSSESNKSNELNENFQNKYIKEKEVIKENFRYEGIIMIILAAITEALIYFVVRRIKTTNNWNHLFISYFFGAIFLSLYYFKSIKNIEIKSALSLSIIINIFLGLFGYLLRFYAISNLDAKIYAPLSYFGILMAYIYGIIINKDKITITKIIGSIFIIIPSIYISSFIFGGK
jgi:drug/metabolite transporter (DMT)-like permease